MNDITVAIQYVDPTGFGLDKVRQNAEFTRRAARKNYQVITPRGVPLRDVLELRHTQNGLQGKVWAILKGKDRTVYLASYVRKRLSTLGVDSITQIKVWKDAQESAASPLPKAVFWKFLPTLSDVMVSDKLQTPDGSRFWTNRVSDCFSNNGFSAYVWASDTRRLYRLKDDGDFREANHYIWDTFGNLHIRLLIARKGLLDAKARPIQEYIVRREQRERIGKPQY